MKFGLWFLPAGAIGAVSTILAASLPVPPSLPGILAGSGPAKPALVAAAPGPATGGAAIIPPATIPTRAALAPPPPRRAAASARPRRVPAGAIAARGVGPRHLARSPTHRLAGATPDQHRQVAARALEPRYGAIVSGPPAPYPGMPVREPTQIAMAPPPPYGMPAPYWRAPYPPR
jgi:hypothetical protein